MRRYNALPDGHRLAARFVVQRPLGYGRSSAVYRALDLHTQTPVALKILDPFLAQDAVSLERFRREVVILRAVDHPNVVKVYEFLADGELQIICMEYVDALDGKAYMARFGRLPLAEFLSVALSIVAALDACHRLGLLHRDLKPQNILITSNRDVKLVDFGISRINTMSDLTKTGTILGTPEYMAPELFRSTTADPRSDIFALGAIFYEFLTGRPPYVATSLSTIMTRQLRGEIEALSIFRTDIPAWLESIIAKCLKTDPNARYQSCYELISDMRRGERALVVTEEKQPPTPCLNCKRTLIPGLPLCPQCGTFSHDLYEKGRYHVVLYGCDDVGGLAEYLLRIFPVRARTRVHARLRKPPVVLFRSISHRTATSLLNELAALPCELHVTRNLLGEFKLPRVYIGFAILAFTPFLLMGGDSAMQRLAMTAAAELALASLYFHQIRPLINLTKLPSRRLPGRDTKLVKIAATLKGLSDSGLKTMLGNIVASSLRVQERISRTPTIFDAERIAAVVFKSLDAARILEGFEVYLSSRSLNDIKDKLNAVDMRLQEAQEPARVAELVDARSNLKKEFREYQAIQELHSHISLALLNLRTVLRRIEDATRGEEVVGELDTDLAHLEEDLEFPNVDEQREAAA